jgi:hypothetical protein
MQASVDFFRKVPVAYFKRLPNFGDKIHIKAKRADPAAEEPAKEQSRDDYYDKDKK